MKISLNYSLSKRFASLQKGKDRKKMSLAEMDLIWDEAKRLERE